jgi:hypothetical protein
MPTVVELRKEASRLNIPGRSKMNKQALIDAINELQSPRRVISPRRITTSEKKEVRSPVRIKIGDSTAEKHKKYTSKLPKDLLDVIGGYSELEYLEEKKEAIKMLREGRKFRILPEKIPDDEYAYTGKNVVLANTTRFGAYAYMSLSLTFLDDEDIVLAAVQEDGTALRYASARLKDDKEVVLVAVEQNGEALKFADEKLKSDREVVLTAVEQNGEALEFADEKLQDDEEVVLAAVHQDGFALIYASADLQDDREVVLVAVHQDGNALEFASVELQANKEVVLAAVLQYTEAFGHADLQLQRDDDFIREIEEELGYPLDY